MSLSRGELTPSSCRRQARELPASLRIHPRLDAASHICPLHHQTLNSPVQRLPAAQTFPLTSQVVEAMLWFVRFHLSRWAANITAFFVFYLPPLYPSLPLSFSPSLPTSLSPSLPLSLSRWTLVSHFLLTHYNLVSCIPEQFLINSFFSVWAGSNCFKHTRTELSLPFMKKGLLFRFISSYFCSLSFLLSSSLSLRTN